MARKRYSDEDTVLPVPWVNVRGDRAFISGHGPQQSDGSPAGPFGAVGKDVSVDEAHELAKKVGLSMLGSLQCELGSGLIDYIEKIIVAAMQIAEKKV